MQNLTAVKDLNVEEALDQWRRKAVDVLMAASAVAYLPGLVLLFLGREPRFSLPIQAILLIAYLNLVVSAVMRQADYRKRAFVAFSLGYLLSAVGGIASPDGPFIRALPICLPVIVLVLSGERAAIAATVVSIFILIFLPALSTVPEIARYIAADGQPSQVSLVLLVTRGLALTATLVATMAVLMRFQQFLMQALTSEHRASSDLAKRAVELTDAHSALKEEMGERRRLEREIARVGDEERRNLGQDLHDGVCQQLTGALLRCQSLKRRLELGEALSTGEIETLSSLLDDAIDETHAISQGLYPLKEDPKALAPALRALARRTQAASGIQCQFRTTGDVSVPDYETACHLYRIAQEALSNASRHARANNIQLQLKGTDGELSLQVTDDGTGLPETTSSGGMGLRTMAYRANLIGGKLDIASMAGAGTCLTCSVPRNRISNLQVVNDGS